MQRRVDLWGNLAGTPAHWSQAIKRSASSRRRYEGIVKLRLGHSAGRSYLIPDILFAVAEARYFIPHFFSAPFISFNIEPQKHVAEFSIDVGAPRDKELERLLIRISSDDRLLTYSDGAQLYRCTFEGPKKIASLAKGLCRRESSGDFLIQAYHHTTSANAANIRQSGELWSSPWNLAGTRKLRNVAYGYLTTLSKIKDEDDLRLIAMSSQGTIQFQTTSERNIEEILSLQVYRGNTRQRTSQIRFEISCGLIAPCHLYFHQPARAEPAYFEVISPEIIRVGVQPLAKLQISGSQLSVQQTDLKTFSYVIIGDASTREGLAAPYNEEETTQITHLEQLDNGMDLFSFWLSNQNTDQVSARAMEPRDVEPI